MSESECWTNPPPGHPQSFAASVAKIQCLVLPTFISPHSFIDQQYCHSPEETYTAITLMLGSSHTLYNTHTEQQKQEKE